MASPAPPTNVSATVDANDQITLTWDYDPTWFAFDGDDGSLGGFNEGRWYSSSSVDHFEIEFSRDGIGYKVPAGGPETRAYDGSTSYSGTYGPKSDNDYGTQVGIDSMFKFRVRAVNADGASDWTASGTVYTDPIPPQNPSVNRPDANTIEFNWYNESDISEYSIVQIRRDNGNGYDSWSNWENVTISPNSSTSVTISVGDSVQYGNPLQEDERYQFRIDTRRKTPNQGTYSNKSSWVYTDYGNNGNVYFEDDFESGDFSAWDSTPATDEYTYVGTDLQGYSSGVAAEPDPPEGSYGAQISDGKGMRANLGDLSSESDVIVKAYVQSASLDSDSENNAIKWHDGSSWTTLETFGHEHNKQGWVEVTALVPDSLLTTDCKVRFAQGNGSGGYDDHFFVDRVVVSDILHEYTKPAAPVNLSLDNSIEEEITATWDDGANFAYKWDINYRETGGSWISNVWENTTSHTYSSLSDGEEYEIEVSTIRQQDRNGEANTYPKSDWPSAITTTILPAPTGASISNITPTSADLSWTDNADNEDAQRVYLEQAGNPTGMNFVRSNSEYVQVDNTPVDQPSGFTISQWGLLEDTEDYQTGWGNSGGGTWWTEFRRDGNQGISWKFTDTSGNEHEVNSNIIANTGEWYHLVGTFDGSTAKIYVNGTEEGSSSISATFQMPSNFSIGSYNSGGSVHDGKLRDTAQYNRAVSASEATDLYNGEIPPNGLIGYWPLDHNHNGVTRDLSEYNNDGTVNGATLVGDGLTDVSGALAAGTTSYSLSSLLNDTTYNAYVHTETEHSITRDI